MNSQPLDPNTADSTAGEVPSTAGRPALSPDVSPTDVSMSAVGSAPALSSPAPSPSNGTPAPKPGIRTTQFWMLAGVLALVAWMVFAGKLDAGWFATLAPAAALIYQIVRENLYRDASTHPHDALNQLLETILGHLPSPTSADATALITALQGESARSTVHSAQSSPEVTDLRLSRTPPPQSSVSSSLGDENSPASSPGVGLQVALCLLCLLVTNLFTGCAQTPYYVSGISGTVDTSKDGAGLTGGGVALTISPNPNYPLPKPSGLAK